MAELCLDNAMLHVLDGANWLYTKWLLHEQDTEGKYLVYAPFSRSSDAEKIDKSPSKAFHYGEKYKNEYISAGLSEGNLSD